MWHLEYYLWYYKSYYFVEKAPSKLLKDANCVDHNFVIQAQVCLKYLYPQMYNYWDYYCLCISLNPCKSITTLTETYILCFLILCRGVLSFRFGAYETIYNPVLSDYFGLTERDTSYFFFGLVIAQTSGTVLL